ncbi:Aldehyde dehydrogenase (NAD(+)) [Bertholletia excelsa]
MESENAKKEEEFDSEAAGLLLKELRATFATGKTRSYEWRVSQLKSLLKLTSDHEEDIIHALHSDLSKPALEAALLEIASVKSSCEFMLKRLKQWVMPERVKSSIITFPSSSRIVPDPLGVVLVMSAWNYPFVLSLDPMIGAIAAGNAVALKPSEMAPATSTLLAKLLGEYMDYSAVKVVEGGVSETSALLEHKWDKIFYTGNAKVGRIVLTAAAKHLTPVTLELGGKCPVIVDSNINLKVATNRIIMGKWGLNNGQTCVAADHIITTKDFAPKLIDTLKVGLERFYGNNPLMSKDISRIVNSNHFSRLTKLLDEDKVSGKIVHGGQRDKINQRISPTLLLDVPEDSLIMKEEIFGPLLPIITVENLEDSFNIINSREKPLAAYLFTNNRTLMEKFARNVTAGGLVINDIASHIMNPHLPFGGVGESGMGSYHGRFSFDNFTHKKAVVSRPLVGDISARYPPYTPGKQGMQKALLSGNIFSIALALFRRLKTRGIP